MRPSGDDQRRVRIAWLAAGIGVCGGVIAATTPSAFVVAAVLVVVLAMVLSDRYGR